MSASTFPVYNAYCDDCAEGYGPFDDEEDAEDAAIVHNNEYHDEPDRDDADRDHHLDTLKEDR